MKVFINNIKLFIGIIIGILVSSISVYAIDSISASDITYDNSTSKLSSSTVQDALNELSIKADYVKFPPTSKNMFLAGNDKEKAICLIKNGDLHCLGSNDKNVLKTQLANAFSDGTCNNDNTRCSDSNISCDFMVFSTEGYCLDGAPQLSCEESVDTNDLYCTDKSSNESIYLNTYSGNFNISK